jgi:hypothetical protein
VCVSKIAQIVGLLVVVIVVVHKMLNKDKKLIKEVVMPAISDDYYSMPSQEFIQKLNRELGEENVEQACIDFTKDYYTTENGPLFIERIRSALNKNVPFRREDAVYFESLVKIVSTKFSKVARQLRNIGCEADTKTRQSRRCYKPIFQAFSVRSAIRANAEVFL